jgi:hypothetical protein
MFQPPPAKLGTSHPPAANGSGTLFRMAAIISAVAAADSPAPASVNACPAGPPINWPASPRPTPAAPNGTAADDMDDAASFSAAIAPSAPRALQSPVDADDGADIGMPPAPPTFPLRAAVSLSNDAVLAVSAESLVPAPPPRLGNRLLNFLLIHPPAASPSTPPTP